MEEFCTFECHVRRLLEEFACFRNLDATCMREVQKTMRVVSRKSDSILFRQGGEADHCYIIISGEVELRSNGGQPPPGFRVQAADPSPEARRHCAVLAAFLAKSDSGKRKTQRAAPKMAPQKDVLMTLKAGTMFGAPGMPDGEAPRLVTAKCASDCELFEMRCEDFARVAKEIDLMRVVRALAASIQLLLAEVPWFREFEPNVHAALAGAARVCFYDKGDLVWRQGAFASDQCYVIVDGSVKMRQSGHTSSKGATSQANDKAEADDERRGIVVEYGTAFARQTCSNIICSLTDSPGEEPSQEDDADTSNDQDEQLLDVEQRSSEYGVEVAHLGVGTVFGETLCDMYEATAMCSERCCFIVFDHSEISRIAKVAETEVRVQQSLPGLVEPVFEILPALHWLKASLKGELPTIVRYTSAKCGSVVYWQDQPATCCRIILSGRVAMWQRLGGQSSEELAASARVGQAGEESKANANGGQPSEELAPAGQDSEGFDAEVPSRCAAAAAGFVALTCDAVVGDQMYMGDETQTGSTDAGRGHDFGLGPQRPTQLQTPGVLQAYGERLASSLGPGDVLLGSEMLVEDADRRSAANRCSCTYVCEEDCQFITIDWIELVELMREEKRKEKLQQLAQRIAKLLKELPFFATLSLEVQQAIANIARYCFKDEGDLLFQEGDEPDNCYIIISGEVTVFRVPENPMAPRAVAPGVRPPKAPVASEARERCLAFASRLGFLNSSPRADRRGSRPDRRGSRPGRRGSRPDRRGSRPDRRGSRPLPIALTKPPTTFLPSVGGDEILSDDDRVDSNASAHPSRSTSPDRLRGQAQGTTRGKVSITIEQLGDATATGGSSMEVDEMAYGHPIVCMGPGSIVGELGLIDDAPRSATVTCWQNSEFLVVGRDEFNKLLKQELRKANDEKLNFLLEFIPAIRPLPESIADRILYQFEKKTLPRKHQFLQQGELHDGSIYMVWKGSVELFTKDANQSPAVRRLGILLRGSVFGQQSKAQLAYSAVATSSPCEVLVVTPDHIRLLPEVVLSNLRKLSEQAVARWKGLKTHFTPLSTFSSGVKSASRLPQLGRTQLRNPTQSLPSGGFTRLPGLMQQHPSFEGLFERPPPGMDYMEFEIEPGETLALGASRPRMRPQKATLRPSVSLPSMRSTYRAA